MVVKSLVDWITLGLVPGLGIKGLWRLVSHFKSPRAVLMATPERLLEADGVTLKQINGLSAVDELRQRAEAELSELRRFGGLAICFDDPLYPPLLKNLYDPPPVLYTLGNPDLLYRPSVAIVGSRAATCYGRRVAFQLAGSLAQRGVTVISGLALGVDTESHKGCLDGGGFTVGVLGCGLDVVYPRQNQSLFKTIVKDGLLVSEYTLGTRPDGFRFPARNRIIAGIAEGVVVVEAARKSGSLITAQIALDAGREVFAVPGQIDSYKSEGTHWLLQQGAKLVQNTDDILTELGHEGVGSLSNNQISPGEIDLEIDPDALALLQLVEPYPQLRDELITKSGKSPGRVSELLLFLELEGLVEMIPGDQVRKVQT